jgi:hypothetical protein
MSRAEDKRAAIIAQQAAREQAERAARGETGTPVVEARKRRLAFRRGPGRPPRPAD